MIRKKIFGIALGLLLLTQVATARNNAALIGVAAAAVVGAAVLANSQPPPPRYVDGPRERYYPQRRALTPNMRIQKTLTNMGLYQGKIDGKLNSYVSRTAIKNLNAKYGIEGGTVLDQRTRDQLLYLSDLYRLDKYLYSESTSKRARGKRLQAALSVHGTYFSGIDGVVGSGTRKAIAQYKEKERLNPTGSLSPNERYDLIESARQMNTKAIDEAIADISPRREPEPAIGDAQQDGENVSISSDTQPAPAVQLNAITGEEVSDAEPLQESESATMPLEGGVAQDEQDDSAAPAGFE